MKDNKCCLCGRCEDADTKTDFLRECYEMGQDGKWDKGLMQPRLNIIEMGKIIQGYNYVCHNRTRCRQRQRLIARNKRIKSSPHK